jgi:metallo-beta-lactamase family protein
MSRIQFLGATGTVTGSRHYLEIQDKKMLVDCGLFQGKKENRLRNWDPFPIPASEIEHVFLTHAHIDHIGYLPRFCRDGFTGKIHATHATCELSEILLKDSAHLQEEDAFYANKRGYSKHKPAKPLYTVEDAEKCLAYFTPSYIGENINLGDGLRVKFRDSGHILGSAFVDIKTTANGKNRKILFSGDMGRSSRPILRDPVQVYNVDYLVMESTYGGRLHETVSPYDELARVIKESAKKRGMLVIPAFAVGRTETLLYVIRELEEQKRIPELPVYVDSPMALEALEVFRKHLVDLDLESRVQVINGKKIFSPAKLHLARSREQSRAINDVKGPAITISASGMAVGGRILHHLSHRLDDRKNTILLVGYQAEGTRGRSLLEGAEFIKSNSAGTSLFLCSSRASIWICDISTVSFLDWQPQVKKVLPLGIQRIQ